jgi:hypothetical protein
MVGGFVRTVSRVGTSVEIHGGGGTRLHSKPAPLGAFNAQAGYRVLRIVSPVGTGAMSRPAGVANIHQNVGSVASQGLKRARSSEDVARRAL